MPFRYLPGAKQCYFQPGESLIRFGEELEYVYYLESGEVYCNALTKEGHAFIFSRKVGGQGVSSLIGILTAYSDPPITINLDRKARSSIQLSFHLVPKLQ